MVDEKYQKYDWLWYQQMLYRELGLKTVWGFGDKMRDYLFEGRRRIRFGR